MASKVYNVEGGDGKWEDSRSFSYGIFTEKDTADKHCLNINKLIKEAKAPFAHIHSIYEEEFNNLSNVEKYRYFQVIDLWEVRVVEMELDVLSEVGVLAY